MLFRVIGRCGRTGRGRRRAAVFLVKCLGRAGVRIAAATSNLPYRAGQPDSRRLMTTRENGIDEIIKTPPAVIARATLTIRLSLIHAKSCGLSRVATRATHPSGQRSARAVVNRFASSINDSNVTFIRGASSQIPFGVSDSSQPCSPKMI